VLPAHTLEHTRLQTPRSAILSAVIFNAVIIVLPPAQAARVKFVAESSGRAAATSSSTASVASSPRSSASRSSTSSSAL
jgi:hypothetical protein